MLGEGNLIAIARERHVTVVDKAHHREGLPLGNTHPLIDHGCAQALREALGARAMCPTNETLCVLLVPVDGRGAN